MNRNRFLSLLLVFFLSIPGILYSQLPESHSVRKSDARVLVRHGIDAPVASDSGRILFQVDLSQWAAAGKFNPATDSIDMPGTFNNWTGSPLLQKVGSTLFYQITLTLEAYTVQEFRFRINRDTNNTENTSHFYRVPYDTTTTTYMYNDFDTTTVPITFKCHMYYQIEALHFNPLPQRDYLDVAGNFNNLGAYDLLFDKEHDSIYQVTLNLSRTLISPSVPLLFKFRINGNWSTSELQGGPFRSYFLHDTTGGIQNIVDVWYDNRNPAIPAPPIAYNVYIQGEYYAGQILTGSYTYEDYNLLPEGVSIYHWYIADSTTQVNPVAIGDSTINYKIDTVNNIGKYIAFEVIPVASGPGDSLIGKPVRVWTGKIGNVGIGEITGTKPGLYPNPASGLITFTNLKSIQRIEIYSITGQRVSMLETPAGNPIFDTSGLSSGIYLVRFLKPDRSYTTLRFIKN